MENLSLFTKKKAEKLKAPEIKIQKPNDTRWLAQEQCVSAVRKSLPALLHTFDGIYKESGDAEAYGLAKLLCMYKFIAGLYMHCDVLHIVANLQAGLQSKEIDFVTIPVMTESTESRLRELKEFPSSTWFNDHLGVFREIRDSEVSPVKQETFMNKVYRPYILGVIDHISNRLESSDVFSAFSIFGPRHAPSSEETSVIMGRRSFTF